MTFGRSVAIFLAVTFTALAVLSLAGYGEPDTAETAVSKGLLALIIGLDAVIAVALARILRSGWYGVEDGDQA